MFDTSMKSHLKWLYFNILKVGITNTNMNPFVVLPTLNVIKTLKQSHSGQFPLKHLIELTTDIVSISFNLHCLDSTPITLENFMEAGKSFCILYTFNVMYFYIVLNNTCISSNNPN